MTFPGGGGDRRPAAPRHDRVPRGLPPPTGRLRMDRFFSPAGGSSTCGFRTRHTSLTSDDRWSPSVGMITTVLLRLVGFLACVRRPRVLGRALRLPLPQLPAPRDHPRAAALPLPPTVRGTGGGTRGRLPRRDVPVAERQRRHRGDPGRPPQTRCPGSGNPTTATTSATSTRRSSTTYGSTTRPPTTWGSQPSRPRRIGGPEATGWRSVPPPPQSRLRMRVVPLGAPRDSPFGHCPRSAWRPAPRRRPRRRSCRGWSRGCPDH